MHICVLHYVLYPCTQHSKESEVNIELQKDPYIFLTLFLFCPLWVESALSLLGGEQGKCLGERWNQRQATSLWDSSMSFPWPLCMGLRG